MNLMNRLLAALLLAMVAATGVQAACTDPAGPGVNWSGCNKNGLRVPGANLSGANLSNATFSPTTKHNADFSNADLTGANFTGPSSFRVERDSQNCWSSSSPVGMWAGCL